MIYLLLHSGHKIDENEFWKEVMKIYNVVRPLYERNGNTWIKR